MAVERKQPADWPHWPERGNGHARRDRLERRLFRDSEREAELAQAQEAIRRIEEAAAAKAAEIDRLEQAVADLDAAPDAHDKHERAPETAAAHLLFVWTAAGYALHDGHGELPVPGVRIAVNGGEYSVAKIARSPLPGDERRCVYLEPL